MARVWMLLSIAVGRAPARRALAPLGCLLALCACARVPPPVTPVDVGRERVAIEGVVACGEPSARLTIDPARPLLVLVHGCHAAQRDLGALSQVIALHGPQTVCFSYDDRDRVAASGARLRVALNQLARRLQTPEITVLGHSQGGLVARSAVSEPRGGERLADARFRLVTVSTPFGGIGAARNCGSVAYHLASFGMSAAVCRAVSGKKWRDIHPRARLVRHPPPLVEQVVSHLAIVTDERETCRRYSLDGRTCAQDDFVFTEVEQRNARIERDSRVVRAEIAAGHVAVVGIGHEPRALLDTMLSHRLLREPTAEEQPALRRLFARLGW